ncbi:MAG: ABC transporter permease [Xanthomonadales bacterium]|nr:ABC transporter permease [Xanthomonadales bacterium]
MPVDLLRQALLRLAGHRSANALIVLVLGLSLGATVCAGLFTHLLISGALPYPQSDRLVIAELQGPGQDDQSRQFSYPVLELLQREAQGTLAASVTLDHARDLLLSHPAQPLLNVTYASPGYAELFAPAMALGRFPGAGQGEDSPAQAVISHAAWVALFDQRADVIGLNVLTAIGSFEIAGVTAADFIEPELHAPGHRTALWLPWAANPSPRQWGWTARTDTLQLVGRLGPEPDLAFATRQLSTRFERGWREATGLGSNAPAEGVPRVRLVEADRALAGGAIAVAPLLLAATLGLMLITVANLAHVVVARVAERWHAFSIQRALGARSARLFLSVLMDALALLLPSALLAFAVAWIGTALMRTQLVHLLPRMDELTIGAPALALSLGAAVLIALVLAGLAYVVCLREGRAGPGPAARAIGASGLPRPLRTALLGLQLGLAGVLIAASLGVFRGAVGILHEPGIDLDRSASLYLYQRLGSAASDAPAAQQFDEMKRRMAELPSVERVSQSHSPLQDFIRTAVVSDRSAAEWPVGLKRIDSGYLALTAQSLVMGRGFSTEDIQQGAPLALINASFARLLARDGEVLGTRLTREGGAAHTVIGVVEDRRYPGAGADDPHLYLPAAQAGSNFVLRFRPGQTMSRAQWVAFVEAVNPGLGVFLYDDLNAQKSELLLPRRIAAIATAPIALLVILTAALGLHGMVAHAGIQMRGEIGARLAFGARPRHVHSALASRHLRGFVLGAALSLVAASLLTATASASGVLALTVRATDVAIALGVLGLLAWLVCVLVARSMLRESPADVLRRAGCQL